MKTTDLFKVNRSAERLNESMEKLFGTKLDLASFDLPRLEDARNKIRTQLSQVRSNSGFNENIENEAITQAQFMLDAINAEILEREEFIADPHVAEVSEESDEAAAELRRIVSAGDFDGLYDLMNSDTPAGKIVQDMYFEVPVDHPHLHPDDDFEEILNIVMDQLEDNYGTGEDDHDTEPPGSYDMSDDADALASAGFGSDEDYESIENEGAEFGAYYYEQLAQKVFDENPNLSTKGRADEVMNAGWKFAVQDLGKKRAQWEFNYDEDFPSDFVSAYAWLQKEHGQEGEGESFAMEKAPPGAKAERMVKHIKAGYAKDGKLTDKEKSIAYATAWKHHNKQNESVNTGDNMTRRLNEGEVQQASAIVTAKTMVDRVSRWIEELSGMENDTLLQLGDSIRDEMSAEQAKTFISQCAPAIQQALQNLKDTRETLSTGVRMLTGEEQGAEMLGGEPGVGSDEGDLGGDEFGAEPDAMNSGDLGGDEFGAPEDEFGASDAGAGGLETAGREQRESIDRSNNLLRVLAG